MEKSIKKINKRKKAFTLIELLAVIVVLAIIAVIVTPLITNIVSSSKKAAYARSVEGHIQSIQNEIMSKALEYGGNLAIYDVENGQLDSSLAVDSRVKCDSYTIKNGTVKEANGCVVDASSNKYAYNEGSGAKEENESSTPSQPSEPTIPADPCDGCVYAVDKISVSSEGSQYRPNQTVYFKYVANANTGSVSFVPEVCGYSKDMGELCIDPLDFYTAVDVMKEYFKYNMLTLVQGTDYSMTQYRGIVDDISIVCQYVDDNVGYFECDNGAFTARITDGGFASITKDENPRDVCESVDIYGGYTEDDIKCYTKN